MGDKAMKQFLKIIVVTMIAIGGIFMANQYGSSDDSMYKEYSSEGPELNITMDYISDWRYQEHRGSYSSYAQVQFYGTVKEGIAPSFVITVERSSKVAFQPLTIEAMADDLIKKRMHFEDAQVVSKSDAELLGAPAIDMTLTYKQLDQLRTIDAKTIPFKERIMIFQKDDKFYTLRYLNPQQAYEEFEQAFLHCIGTLRI